MMKRLTAALLLLALPGASWAEATPKPQKSTDRLLPAGSQIYMRWDGFESHKEAYERTALAKTMKGDLGKFLRALVTQGGEKMELLLSGQVDAQVLQQFREDCGGFLDSVGKHGFSIGVEVRSLEPVEIQAVIVLPQSGADQKSLLSLLRHTSKLAEQQVKELTLGKRKVEHMQAGPVHILWWAEGPDAVLAVGTDTPKELFKRLAGKNSLLDQPLYKQVQNFKEFDTWGRGYVDMAALGKLARTRGKEAGKLLEDLGLDNFKSITFHSGFDGPAGLGVVELDVEGERKGLLSLFSKKTFSLSDLPALPEDVGNFSASSFEWGELYHVGVQTAEAVVRLVAPDKLDQVKDALQRADDATGIKIGEDLFGSLGDMMVSYSVWAEGPLGLGSVTLAKVKDPGKLKKSLEQAFKGIGNLGTQIEVKHSKYHGVEVTQVSMGPGVPLGTYTIHKGWLAYSSYPQPIQGFILRSGKQLPSWKASAEQQKALEPFPKEFVGITVSDPRPTLKALLSVTPVIVQVVNQVMTQFGGAGPVLDPNVVPNAYEATRYLFPNVTVTTDDGSKIRSVTRSSLALPF